MKSIIRTAIVIALSLIMIVGLQSQPQRIEKGNKQKERLDILKHSEDLGLSVKQKAALWDLQNEMRKESKSKAKKNDAKEDRAAIREEYQAKIDEILTDEQVVMLTEIREEHKVQREEERAVRKAEREEVKIAIEEYQETNINPVLVPMRVEFDKLLTAEERSLLSELRETVEAEKSKEHNRRGAEKGDRSAKKNGRSEIKALIEKYEDNLDAIWATIEADAKVWHEDLKEIRQEGREDRVKDGEKSQRGNGKRTKEMRSPRGKNETMSRAKFLLMEV